VHHDVAVGVDTRGVQLVGVKTEGQVRQQRTATYVAVHVTYFGVARLGAVFDGLHLA